MVDIQRAIELMVAATEHIRDCERCRRVFHTTADLLKEEWYAQSPWVVFRHCSRELHECEQWPKGI